MHSCTKQVALISWNEWLHTALHREFHSNNIKAVKYDLVAPVQFLIISQKVFDHSLESISLAPLFPCRPQMISKKIWRTLVESPSVCDPGYWWPCALCLWQKIETKISDENLRRKSQMKILDGNFRRKSQTKISDKNFRRKSQTKSLDKNFRQNI